ncbi:pentapeptide repeat-containing protein [Actinomycetota bacterium Odt1-20B]
MRGRAATRAAATAAIIVVGAATWGWAGSPWRAVVPMARHGWTELPPEARAQAEGQFRLAAIQFLAAVGGGVALAYTARTYRLSRRGQVTDRMVKALERLGSAEVYVRIGAIVALEQVAQDAPDQATHVQQILNAFVRKQVPRRPATDPGAQLGHVRGPKLPGEPEPDVQAALATITRPGFRASVETLHRLDLHGLHLRGVKLPGADLRSANLREVDLSEAELRRCDLSGADLEDAQLVRADLREVMATGVNLYRASLSEAWLRDADLSRARLARVDLTAVGARGADLSGAQLAYARLTGGALRDAVLHDADLSDADLRGAILRSAQLGGAQLDLADLTNADLTRADLESVRNLIAGQVLSARLRDTRLPPDVAADPEVAKVLSANGTR